MIRLAIRELVSRRTATALCAAALLTASFGFLLLAGTAKSTRAVLQGGVDKAWQTPYDLLVRPPGSQTALEGRYSLIRPNYVSGLVGGITQTQLDEIRSIPGVTVAAPIAMVGFVEWPSALEMRLRADPAYPVTVYRVRSSTTGDAGLSRYPIETRYIVIARNSDLRFDPSGDTLQLPGGRKIDCSYPVNCFAARVCGPSGCEAGHYPSTRDARYYLPLLQPIVIAGVDPVAEAKIDGLDGCVTSGRYLSPRDDPVPSGPGEDPPSERIPVLVSTHDFVKQSLTVQVEQSVDLGELATDGAPQDLRSWSGARTTTVMLTELYRRYLQSIKDYADPWPIWSAGNVTYARKASATPGQYATPSSSQAPQATVAAVAHAPDLSIYTRSSTGSEVGISDQLLVPPEARDTSFRRVIEHADGYDPVPGTKFRFKMWNAVGRYDPACLPGFNQLAGGALEAYSTPEVVMPSGSSLGPTRSMSGYVSSPPLLLTTLSGAAWLANSDRYEGQPGRAFISVIRVKVADTNLPGADAQARLEAVAARIHEKTGLLVDVVKGSSTQTVHVDLPPGRFGRPQMTVSEGWWLKGAAIGFTDALRIQDLSLFIVVLAGAMAIVGVSTIVSVKRRRREFGMLRAVGWPVLKIAWLVETELLLLGFAVGMLSLIVGLLLSLLLPRWPMAIAPVSLAIAVGVGAAAGVLPALSVGRGAAAEVMRGQGRIRRSKPARSGAALGLRDLVGVRRAEALLGIGAMTLGSGLLGGVVFAAAAFRDRLDVTTLGQFLGGEVRPFHLALAVVALLFGATAAGEVVTLGYLERQLEFAVLRGMGWPRRNVISVLAAQGLAIGITGGVIAGILILGLGVVTGESEGASLVGASAALVSAIVATGAAILWPLALVYRKGPADALRGE